MNDNETFAIDPETAAAFDSQDIVGQADPLFEGSILATVKSIRQGKRDPESGRMTAVVSYGIEQPIAEVVADENVTPRTFNPGYRISQFLTLIPANNASEQARNFAREDLSSFAAATRVAGKGEKITADGLRKAIDKQVVLKLSTRTDKEGNKRQNVRVKAAPVNGKA